MPVGWLATYACKDIIIYYLGAGDGLVRYNASARIICETMLIGLLRYFHSFNVLILCACFYLIKLMAAVRIYIWIVFTS
jgi:hypothetical protein